ncbi:hypothetical protein WR25_27031 [Diploscapter pachys]|uniref:EF-hand domain-containing protein n=1 Tax=Diploscapter pachys TaxID=2018661 RepID=A0A2A2JND4_9BILA|nr:hypothetical protein WR25_27031 [Diploscapter pachys]
MSLIRSQSQQSIIAEQAHKLFIVADRDDKGFINEEDLGSICDMLSLEHVESLQRIIIDKGRVTEDELFDVLSTQSDPTVVRNPQIIPGTASDPSSGMGPSLADELDAAMRGETTQRAIMGVVNESYSHPLADEMNHMSSSKQMRVSPTMIKRRQFRPIEPPLYPEDPVRDTQKESTLADELSEAENRENGNFGDSVDLRTPDRIFKVVFVGDSAVGKTCFLHRFCYNRFKPLFNATIGVDFTVKTVQLKGRFIALQLWDTAGQERFRSITKQYFRKADGVILMFDVTSEQSFLNVRNWITSVKAGVDESTVMCLVGNKVDIFFSYFICHVSQFS